MATLKDGAPVQAGGAMNHTADCRELYATEEAERAAWLAKWPHHCPTCQGAGFSYWPGTYDTPPEMDACADCTNKGHCPRCGQRAWSDTDALDTACRHCGWNPDAPDSAPIPTCSCLCWDVL